MEIVFLTNFLTHHQTPFCEEMYKRLGDKFHLIAMRSADPEQKKLGYKELNDIYPFVLRVYDSPEQEHKAMALCTQADVVILGSAPLKYIEERRKQNKLTFIYTERIFKRGYIYALHPAMLKMMFQKFASQRKKKQYYLCASAYTAQDINWIVNTPTKFFKWGYFPQTKRYEDVHELIKNKKKNSIIWVGRFIDWKHPELAVEIAKRLKEDGYDFNLQMLGNGMMLEEIKNMVEQIGLGDCVHVLGAKPSEEVRRYMEDAEIHIFTSDKNEGWGAVLNESMNSACAVVANKNIGAAPFLIKDGENGFTYTSTDMLYQRVKYLLGNADQRWIISQNAYNTITQVWNADVAVGRFLALCNSFFGGKPVEYKDGLCSNALVRRFFFGKGK